MRPNKNKNGGTQSGRASNRSAASNGSAVAPQAAATALPPDSDDSSDGDMGSAYEDFDDADDGGGGGGGGGLADELALMAEGCDLSAAVLRKIPRLGGTSVTGQGLSKSESEIVRLIGQYLRNIGLRNSAAVLMTEAGCQQDHTIAASFRKHVMTGEWSSAVTLLEDLRVHLESPEQIVEMKFLLLEQKYLELLYKGNSIEALKVLQTELTPLKHNQARTHELSSYLMFASKEDLMRAAAGAGGGSLDSGDHSAVAVVTDVADESKTRRLLMDRLQEFLPASIMLPPKRLQTLLNQAAEFQIERCLYHNRSSFASLADSPFSLPPPPPETDPTAAATFKIDPSFLSVDHQCSKEDFPCETIQTLADHCEEVWYTKWSPDGRRLATGSKDNTVIIWDLDPVSLTLKHNKSFERHHPAAFFAWSPDSTRIAVCGPEDAEEIFIWNVETGTLESKISNGSEDSLVTVSWSPDGRNLACGGTKGQFYQCDVKGNVLDSWEGVRVLCLSYRRDNKHILAADTHNRIRSYNFDELNDQPVLREDHGIMSFIVDDSDRYALVNVAEQGIHLWDIEEKCLVRKFIGVQQGNYTIYSCFGGVDQNFVASGSEDNKVYIYHVRRESPIAVLSGHTRTVSCVSWNPVYHQVLASGSDDGTVRIWGPAEKFRNRAARSALGGLGVPMATSNGQDNCQNNHVRNGVV